MIFPIEHVTSSKLILVVLVSCAHAQYGVFGGSSSGLGSPFPGGSSYGGGSSGNGGSSFSKQQGDSDYATNLFGRTHVVAHGVLASLALVIFFPFGAISIRVIPATIARYIHIAFQVTGYVLLVAAFGLGLWMARQINFGDLKLIDQYHPIIGIVVFAFLSLQPILGVVHHYFFHRYGKRTVWSHAHLWIGRLFITLGIINGGLGLRFADNAGVGAEAAYGAVAGIVWLVWMVAAIYGEVRRAHNIRYPPPYQRHAHDAIVKDEGHRQYYA